MKKQYVVILIFLFLVSCSQSLLYINPDEKKTQEQIPPPKEDLIYQTFLIGDAGEATLQVQEPVLKLFESFLKNAGERSAAIFLGDNIYSAGLPDSTHPDRKLYEGRIIELMKTVENFEGRVVILAGNHDWDNGGPEGLERVLRQEEFVEKTLDRGNVFLPDHGFPGPVSIKLLDDDEDPRLREDIRLIVLNTQWWFHRYEKPFGDTGEYELFDAGDVLSQLDNLLKKQRNDYLMIAAHHPLITHDNHGGYLPPSAHLKPPVFGSLYVLYRRVFGLRQDVIHHHYKKMADAMQELFSATELEDMIYVAGHSHGLQYHRQEVKRVNHHYIVSGAGSKRSYISHGRGAEFTYGSRGFITVQYYADGSVWMEAWAPKGDGSTGTLLYKTQLKPPFEVAFSDEAIAESFPDIDYSDSTRTVAANPWYDGKSRLFEWLIGKHNRKYWSVENEFPLFDVTELEEGLTPVRIGGKGQSTTLHLEREDGRDYVLRSVDKRAGRIWDDNLRKTFALDVAQDQFSIINPYAALVIPDLADAAGVYHTNPTIYFVPDDPQLGAYTNEISGELALFEERPNGDMSDVESVGNSDEILSSTELFRELDGDIDHRVDQKEFARARLLDMLLADWDRHSDQWRWASFEPEDKKGKIYKPIPRDRDVAMMRMTGLLPSTARVLGPFFQYQNFSESYGNLKGLNFNSLGLTRLFTNQVTRTEWLEIALDIEKSLTDAVIEEAVQNYPDPVFEKYGDETIRILKARRDQLPEVAERYYNLISGVVSIPGSNKRELFRVDVLTEDEILVRVYKLSGEGERREQYFERTFAAGETEELRLYGMGGRDQFRITGVSSNPIKIRISGGSGEDEYIDETTKKGIRRTVFIYDTETGNHINRGPNSKVKLANQAENVSYNYKSDFRWNTTLAGLYFDYNSKDGLFLGGGPEIIRHGFRKHPSSRHFLRANVSPSTGAANIRYDGAWYLQSSATSNRRVEFDAQFLFPKSYKNFFGLGNETTLEDRSLNYYRARLYQYSVEPRFVLNKNIMEFYTGIHIRATNVEQDPDNILSDPILEIPAGEFKEQLFSGITAGLKFSDLDDGQNPREGFRLLTEGDVNLGIVNTDQSFTRLKSELELYFSLQTDRQVTIANRSGGNHTFGEFPFYEANTIGGTTNLRGFNGRRFSGRSAFFNNTELRLELFDFYNYFLGGRVGLNGFFDTGRVWVDGESSSVFHYGYGGGIWFNMFDSFLINTAIGFSEDGSLYTIKTGFLF